MEGNINGFGDELVNLRRNVLGYLDMIGERCQLLFERKVRSGGTEISWYSVQIIMENRFEDNEEL